MAITILDYVRTRVGHKDSYPAEDFYSNGVDMLGGCEICGATIGPWNAYPSTSGYWRCSDCIDDQGYDTTADFETAVGLTRDNKQADSTSAGQAEDHGILCPACQNAAHIIETRDQVFECGDCGATWSA